MIELMNTEIIHRQFELMEPPCSSCCCEVVKEGEDYNLLLMKISRDGRDWLFDSIFAERPRKPFEPGTPPGSLLRAGEKTRTNRLEQFTLKISFCLDVGIYQ